MKYVWKIAPAGGEVCGYCGERVPEGQPIEEMSREGLTRKLYRCELHAHTPIDQAAVDAARRATLERFAPPPDPASPLVNAGTRRHTLRRPTTAFTKLDDLAASAFDPKAAAANDND